SRRGRDTRGHDTPLTFRVPNSSNGWNPAARGDPFLVGLKLQAEPFVENLQIAVSIAHDRPGRDRLHFLRNDSNIRLVSAVVAETIKAKAVVEVAQKGNVVLEPYVGPPSATAAPTAAASASKPSTPQPAAAATGSDMSSATEARSSALRLEVGRSAGPHVSEGTVTPRAVRTAG